MNTDEKLDFIKKRIENYYSHILLRPQLFCNRIAIEAFVQALENILDCMDDSIHEANNDRIDSYRVYLSDLQYGASNFQSRFEMNNDCTVGFINLEQYSTTVGLNEKFSSEFREHWSAFLEWRGNRNPTDN